MEIFVVLELLPDQGGADHLAVLLDQAALRLLREDHAGDRGHGQRIGKPRDQRQQRRAGRMAGRISSFNMDRVCSPQDARCKAATTRSIALMPMKGMMMPPRP